MSRFAETARRHGSFSPAEMGGGGGRQEPTDQERLAQIVGDVWGILVDASKDRIKAGKLRKGTLPRVSHEGDSVSLPWTDGDITKAVTVRVTPFTVVIEGTAQKVETIKNEDGSQTWKYYDEPIPYHSIVFGDFDRSAKSKVRNVEGWMFEDVAKVTEQDLTLASVVEAPAGYFTPEAGQLNLRGELPEELKPRVLWAREAGYMQSPQS